MPDQHDPKDRPAAGTQREPQPWHAADENRPAAGGSPIGTHSLTGGGANVGMPAKPAAGDGAERSEPAGQGHASEPDPLAEPRADIAEILGRKP